MIAANNAHALAFDNVSGLPVVRDMMATGISRPEPPPTSCSPPTSRSDKWPQSAAPTAKLSSARGLQPQTGPNHSPQRKTTRRGVGPRAR